MLEERRRKMLIFLFISCILLALSVLAAIYFGSTKIPLSEIIKIIFYHENSDFSIIIWDIRMPRIILALIVGANLAASGALLQAVGRPRNNRHFERSKAGALTGPLDFSAICYGSPPFRIYRGDGGGSLGLPFGLEGRSKNRPPYFGGCCSKHFFCRDKLSYYNLKQRQDSKHHALAKRKPFGTQHVRC